MNKYEKIVESKNGLKSSQRSNTTYSLRRYLKSFNSSDASFLQLVIISIVSSNESFFKETIAWLIDDNEKFCENCKQILNKKGIRIEIDALIQISKKNFSVGDLIAYSLSYSTIDRIISDFRTITEIDIYNELKDEKYVRQLLCEVEVKGELDDELNEELDESYEHRPYILNQILNSLSESYKLRHIICHDFLSTTHKIKIDPTTVKGYLIDTIYFQEAITSHISEKLYREKIDKRYENLLIEIDNQNAILNDIYAQIEAKLRTEEQKLRFKQNVKDFEDFVTNDTNEVGRWFRGETIPFFKDLEYEHRLKLINQRIELLEKEIQ